MHIIFNRAILCLNSWDGTRPWYIVSVVPMFLLVANAIAIQLTSQNASIASLYISILLQYDCLYITFHYIEELFVSLWIIQIKICPELSIYKRQSIIKRSILFFMKIPHSFTSGKWRDCIHQPLLTKLSIIVFVPFVFPPAWDLHILIKHWNGTLRFRVISVPWWWARVKSIL